MNWKGWPDGKRFAFVLTHDVETSIGRDQCLKLASLDAEYGFQASYQLVPKRYEIPNTFREDLDGRGCEIGVHGLCHDGKLFRSRKIFDRRAAEINTYIEKWGASGFRAPAMHHNLSWIRDLNIEYDASTFDTDPFEPQPDSARTIFPFLVSATDEGDTAYVELPYTLPQDSTLFLLLGDQGPDTWIRKLDWIAECGGMALFITHPDYMDFADGPRERSRYPVRYYREFLDYVRRRYDGQYWHALPRDVGRWCRRRTEQLRTGKPKTVGMVAYTFYEQDNRVMRYAESLVERGDHVDVMVLNDGKSPPMEIMEGVHVHRVQHRKLDERSQWSYLIRLTRFLHRCTRHINRIGAITPYDLIHIHNMPDFLVFSAVRQKRRGTKIIHDIHDLVPEFYAAKFGSKSRSPAIHLLCLIEKAATRFADHNIVSNHLWRDVLVERTVPVEKLSTVLNYPDPRIFSYGRRPEINGSFTLVYPGSLNWHQGLDIAIRAVALLRKEVPGLRFLIYGDGGERENLVALAGELGVTGVVSFENAVSLREVPDLVREADIGIIPKRSDSFGNQAFSTKMLEFMSLGVPVIVSDTEIDRYYFSDEIATFFRSGDPGHLAERVMDLYRNPSRKIEQAENALVFAQSHNWGNRKSEYFELVDNLCSQE